MCNTLQGLSKGWAPSLLLSHWHHLLGLTLEACLSGLMTRNPIKAGTLSHMVRSSRSGTYSPPSMNVDTVLTTQGTIVSKSNME